MKYGLVAIAGGEERGALTFWCMQSVARPLRSSGLYYSINMPRPHGVEVRDFEGRLSAFISESSHVYFILQALSGALSSESLEALL